MNTRPGFQACFAPETKVSMYDGTLKNIEDIEKAAKSLGLNPVLEKEISYPSKHWKKDGRILVDKNNSKGKIIRQLADKLK